MAQLRRGELPAGAQVLKASPLRRVVRAGECVLKVLERRPQQAAREARVLARARALGVPVPELLAHGPGWLATRFAPGRPAQRADLPAILQAIHAMHERGMLHGDLHLGNVHMTADGPLFLDVQKASLLRWLPGWLRRRELGYLAFSLEDPLPPELAHTALWRALRAQRHWRSRTRRALAQSSGFTRFELGGVSGWRRRELDAAALERVLGALQAGGADAGELLKEERGVRLVRVAGWIAKRHASRGRARAAWLAGHGLAVRGIPTARALAWWGRWLVMEDAGATLHQWVEAQFADAGEAEQRAALEAVATLLAKLHSRGIYHADLKANNVAYDAERGPRLLDYGRVHFGLWVSRRRRVKNLAQLNAALPDRVPAPLREHALAHYLRCLGGPPADAELRARVIRTSLRRAHLWRGC